MTANRSNHPTKNVGKSDSSTFTAASLSSLKMKSQIVSLLLFLNSIVIATAELTPETLAVAKEVVAAVQIKERLPKLAEMIITMDAQQKSAKGYSEDEIKKSISALREYFEHDFDVEGLEAKMAELYAKDFNIDELNQILGYLKSPAIKKFMDTQGPRMAQLNEYMLKEIEAKAGSRIRANK